MLIRRTTLVRGSSKFYISFQFLRRTVKLRRKQLLIATACIKEATPNILNVIKKRPEQFAPAFKVVFAGRTRGDGTREDEDGRPVKLVRL